MALAQVHSTPVVFRIGPDNESWLRQCAEIHSQEIADGFLTSFGVPFLTEMYRAIARGPSTFLLGASASHRLVGLICGSSGGAGPLKSMLKSRPIHAIRFAAPTLLRPSNLRRALETISYMGSGGDTDGLPRAEILNFAVSRSTQGQGVGRLLFQELCAEFTKRGVDAIRIVTGSDQTAAQRFYEAAGARPAGNLAIHEGASSVAYVYELSDRETP